MNEAKNRLGVIKLTDQNFNCIHVGKPVLLEKVGETLDPALELILLKQTFVQLFDTCIENSEKTDDLDKRLEILLLHQLRAWGLFEKNKLVFLFMLCGEIMQQRRGISEGKWSFFLRGSGSLDKERHPKPDVPWLNERKWDTCCNLEDRTIAVDQSRACGRENDPQCN